MQTRATSRANAISRANRRLGYGPDTTPAEMLRNPTPQLRRYLPVRPTVATVRRVLALVAGGDTRALNAMQRLANPPRPVRQAARPRAPAATPAAQQSSPPSRKRKRTRITNASLEEAREAEASSATRARSRQREARAERHFRRARRPARSITILKVVIEKEHVDKRGGVSNYTLPITVKIDTDSTSQGYVPSADEIRRALATREQRVFTVTTSNGFEEVVGEAFPGVDSGLDDAPSPSQAVNYMVAKIKEGIFSGRIGGMFVGSSGNGDSVKSWWMEAGSIPTVSEAVDVPAMPLEEEGMRHASVLKESFMKHIAGISPTAFDATDGECVVHQLHHILTRPNHTTPITLIPTKYEATELVALTTDSLRTYLNTVPSKPKGGGYSPRQIGLLCSDLRINMYALDITNKVFLRVDDFAYERSRVHRDVYFNGMRIASSRHHPIVFYSANRHMYMIDDEDVIKSIAASCSEAADSRGRGGEEATSAELEAVDVGETPIADLLTDLVASPRSGLFVVNGTDCLLDSIRTHLLPIGINPVVKMDEGKVTSLKMTIVTSAEEVPPPLPVKPVRSQFDKHKGGDAYKNAMMVYERDMEAYRSAKKRDEEEGGKRKSKKLTFNMTVVVNPCHFECLPVAAVKSICASGHIKYSLQGPGALANDLAHAAQRRKFTDSFVRDVMAKCVVQVGGVAHPACAMCSRAIKRGDCEDEAVPCEVDHITPVAAGGSNDIDNLQALCLKCHALKTQSQLSTVRTPDYHSMVSTSVAEHVMPYAKSWAFSQTMFEFGEVPEDARQYDCNTMYFHILRDGLGAPWPVFSVMDKVERFQAPLREAGLYYVKTSNTFPMRGCMYYDVALVRYCLELHIIEERDILWQCIPSKCLKPDHFAPYQDRITSALEGMEEALELACKDAPHAVSANRVHKFLQNAFVGSMAPTDSKSEWMRLTMSQATASSWRVSDGETDQLTCMPFPEMPEVYMGVFGRKSARTSTACFIRHAVISRSNIVLHRLYNHVLSIGGTPLWLKTDCIGYSGTAPLNLDEWKWSNGDAMLKEETPSPPMHNSLDGFCHELVPFHPREWTVDSTYDGDATAYAAKLVAMRSGMLIHGKPGTGKSFLLSTFIEQLEKEKRKFMALTPTHANKKNVGHCGVDGHADSALHKKECKDVVHTVEHVFRLVKGERGSILSRLKSCDYLIVDEVSMMREQQYAMLVYIKRRIPGLHIVLVGDFRQLAPVNDSWEGSYEDSAALIDLCDATRIELVKCLRESESEVFHMLDDVYSGEEVDVASHFPVLRPTMINLAYTHKTRKRVNEECMQLMAAGRATLRIECPEHDEAQTVTLVNGSPVICIKTVEVRGLFNGEMYTLTSFNDEVMELTSNLDGSVLPIEVSEFHKLFRVGHCLTVHQSQGMTIREPYTIYDWHHACMRKDPSARYVALSRCTRKADVQIHTNGVVSFVEPIDTARIEGLLQLIASNVNDLTDEQMAKVQARKDFLEKMLTRPSSVVYTYRGLGRLYASDYIDGVNRGRSLQGCPADLRAALVGHVGHDIDLVNSLPMLTVQWLSKVGLDEGEYCELKDYVENRAERLSQLAEWNGVSLAEAKTLYLITMFGGDTHCAFPHLLRLAAEIRSLHHNVVQMHLEIPKYRELYESRLMLSKGDVSAAERSTFSIMTHEVEDCIMEKVREYLDIRGVRVFALTFDGVITSECTPELLRGAEAHLLEYDWVIQLVEKPLFGMQDEVPESLKCLSPPRSSDAASVASSAEPALLISPDSSGRVNAAWLSGEDAALNLARHLGATSATFDLRLDAVQKRVRLVTAHVWNGSSKVARVNIEMHGNDGFKYIWGSVDRELVNGLKHPQTIEWAQQLWRAVESKYSAIQW